MGKSFKQGRSGHGKPSKKHPHKDDRFYKDEFHERKNTPFKKKKKDIEIDGFDLLP